MTNQFKLTNKKERRKPSTLSSTTSNFGILENDDNWFPFKPRNPKYKGKITLDKYGGYRVDLNNTIHQIKLIPFDEGLSSSLDEGSFQTDELSSSSSDTSSTSSSSSDTSSTSSSSNDTSSTSSSSSDSSSMSSTSSDSSSTSSTSSDSSSKEWNQTVSSDVIVKSGKFEQSYHDDDFARIFGNVSVKERVLELEKAESKKKMAMDTHNRLRQDRVRQKFYGEEYSPYQ